MVQTHFKLAFSRLLRIGMDDYKRMELRITNLWNDIRNNMDV